MEGEKEEKSKKNTYLVVSKEVPRPPDFEKRWLDV